MKQPKVSAAITLSEKANREFARDRTVFIVATFPSRAPAPTLALQALLPAVVLHVLSCHICVYDFINLSKV